MGFPDTRLLPATILALLCGVLAAPAFGADAVEVGRRIYQEGVLSDGSVLRGTRLDGTVVTGADATCAQCHRPSGMGAVEGDIQAPPVTGNALFSTGDRVIATMDPRSGKAFNRAHEPYTDATVVAAVREGRRVDGQKMQPLMPRYRLGPADMDALVAYLHSLSSSWSPGVDDSTIHFATVVAPDVPAARRALFIDMAKKIVAQKNGSTMTASTGRSRHHMTSAAELVLGTERRWVLDVWELHGAPDTWAAQLETNYARQPVFALVSGLGGSDWGPVDSFCDRERVPCWFPSVTMPPANAPRYSLYFSGGVVLETRVLATQLMLPEASPTHRVIQVFRDDATGRGAAKALTDALASSKVQVVDRIISGDAATAVQGAVADAGPSDVVMFWLAEPDVAQLQAFAPPVGHSYFSAVLGGAERIPLKGAWRTSAQLVYPYELPGRRAANLAYFKAWLNQRHIPLDDEIMQSQVYFSFAFLTDTISEMLNNLHRDYLLERAETMIAKREGSKAEAEYYSSTQNHVRTHAQSAGVIADHAASVEAPGLQALQLAGSSFGKREGTTVFPRLTLGPGQRFASKGGYIAHFDGDGALVADSAWSVP